MEFTDNIKLLTIKKSKTHSNTISEKFDPASRHSKSFDDISISKAAPVRKCSKETNKGGGYVMNLETVTGTSALESVQSQGNQDVVLLEEYYFEGKTDKNESSGSGKCESQDGTSHKLQKIDNQNILFDENQTNANSGKLVKENEAQHESIIISATTSNLSQTEHVAMLTNNTSNVNIFKEDNNKELKKNKAKIDGSQSKKSNMEITSQEESKIIMTSNVLNEANRKKQYHSNDDIEVSMIDIAKNSSINVSEKEEAEFQGDTSFELMVPSSYDEETALALEISNNDQNLNSSLSEKNIHGYDSKEYPFSMTSELIILDDTITTQTNEPKSQNLESTSPNKEKDCTERERLQSFIEAQVDKYDFSRESKNSIHSVRRLHTEELPESSLLDDQTFDASVNNDTTYDTTVNNDTMDEFPLHYDAPINMSTEKSRRTDSNRYYQPEQSAKDNDFILKKRQKSRPTTSNGYHSSNNSPEVAINNSATILSINKTLIIPRTEKKEVVKQNKEETISYANARYKSEKNNNTVSSGKNKTTSKSIISKLSLSKKTSTKIPNKKISLADLCAKSSPRYGKYRVGLSKKQSVDHLHDYLPK